MKLTRRVFIGSASVGAAAVATPLLVEAAVQAAHHHQAAEKLAALLPKESQAPDETARNELETERTTVSVADTLAPLPYGVWVGLGLSGTNETKEADYFGYHRVQLTSGYQIAGCGGFYRVITDLEFPARKGGCLAVNQLLIFETDRIDPGDIQPLHSHMLPQRLFTRAKSQVVIRDVSLDLGFGQNGTWKDDDPESRLRLKQYFQGTHAVT